MRIIDRYLLRELLVPLAFCLCGFLIFWIAFDLFANLQDLQEHKLHAADIAKLYLVKTPEFLVLILPVALLLALLYTLTNHARHHELTAMRGAGISLWRLTLPYFCVGLVMSLVMFALNELCVPNTDELADDILNSRIVKKANKENSDIQKNFDFTNARERRIWHTDLYNAEAMEMTQTTVEWTLPNHAYRQIVAKRAAYTNGVWTFFDVLQQTYSPTSTSPTNRDFFAILPMRYFSETPEQIKSEIKISNRLNFRSGRRADIPLVEIWNYLRLHPQLSRTDKSWLFTKLHGRLAMPWTCLVVVLIAIPFGAPSARRNVFVGVASSIVICFAFFVLLQLALALGGGGYLPPVVAAWLPNLSFGIAGAWLTARVR